MLPLEAALVVQWERVNVPRRSGVLLCFQIRVRLPDSRLPQPLALARSIRTRRRGLLAPGQRFPLPTGGRRRSLTLRSFLTG